jgi:hypothetical protein
MQADKTSIFGEEIDGEYSFSKDIRKASRLSLISWSTDSIQTSSAIRNVRSSINPCVHDNWAAYGDCIASTSSKIELQLFINQDAQVFAGLPIRATAKLLDAYDQVLSILEFKFI